MALNASRNSARAAGCSSSGRIKYVWMAIFLDYLKDVAGTRAVERFSTGVEFGTSANPAFFNDTSIASAARDIVAASA